MTDESVAPESVAALKDALRREARARRAALSPAFRAESARRLVDIFRAAFSVSALPPGVVAGYWPLGDEMDPRPLLAALRAEGRAVALPVTGARRTPLIFRLWDPDRPLVAGRFGTMVPDDAQPQATPAVMLLPLLAFDRAGGRLGYGGGYYDRTLGLLRDRGAVLAVALAYAAQEFSAVPRGPYDRPPDRIVTESEAIAVNCG